MEILKESSMIIEHFWTKYPEEKDKIKENNMKRKRGNVRKKLSITKKPDITRVPSQESVTLDVTIESEKVSVAKVRLEKHRQVMFLNKISCRSVASHKGDYRRANRWVGGGKVQFFKSLEKVKANRRTKSDVTHEN